MSLITQTRVPKLANSTNTTPATGTEYKYHGFETFSSASMNAHLAEWCALFPVAET